MDGIRPGVWAACLAMLTGVALVVFGMSGGSEPGPGRAAEPSLSEWDRAAASAPSSPRAPHSTTPREPRAVPGTERRVSRNDTGTRSPAAGVASTASVRGARSGGAAGSDSAARDSRAVVPGGGGAEDTGRSSLRRNDATAETDARGDALDAGQDDFDWVAGFEPRSGDPVVDQLIVRRVHGDPHVVDDGRYAALERLAFETVDGLSDVEREQVLTSGPQPEAVNRFMRRAIAPAP